MNFQICYSRTRKAFFLSRDGDPVTADIWEDHGLTGRDAGGDCRIVDRTFILYFPTMQAARHAVEKLKAAADARETLRDVQMRAAAAHHEWHLHEQRVRRFQIISGIVVDAAAAAGLAYVAWVAYQLFM